MKDFEAHLRKQDLNSIKTLLDEYDRSKKFSACDSFDEVMEQVKMRSSLFNLRLIKLAIKGFPCKEVHEKLHEYRIMKRKYCENTSIRKFEHVSPSSSSSKVLCQECLCGGSNIPVKFKIGSAMKHGKTVEHIVKCAKDLFDCYYNHLSEMNREHGSEYVTWNLPVNVASHAIGCAKERKDVLNEHGVDKVTILKDVDLFSSEKVYKTSTLIMLHFEVIVCLYIYLRSCSCRESWKLHSRLLKRRKRCRLV